jgi:hypothetical protein
LIFSDASRLLFGTSGKFYDAPESFHGAPEKFHEASKKNRKATFFNCLINKMIMRSVDFIPIKDLNFGLWVEIFLRI